MREEKEKIVYQNQSHLVLDYFKHRGIIPTLLEIALCTDIMTQFCVNGYSKELKERFDKLEEHLALQYKK